MEETIVSLATSGGGGAISIVRLSGENAYQLALKHTKKSTLTPRIATLTNLYDNNGNLIDEAIVLFFKNPKSYTGEDLVEFQTHGGSVVASLLIDSLLESGARTATPGEFTKRAVMNDKMDLTKAEAVSALISSKSKSSVKYLARQLQGELGKFVDNIRKDLIEIIAHSEVSIDYAEEDLPDDILNGIKSKIDNINKILSKTLSASLKRDGLLNGYKVAIIGKPNAGKSSLLNRLLSYERAIVSDIAGTTRDSVEAELYIADHLVKIIDTAGIREGIEVIERIGIERSKEIAKEADLVLGVFDGSLDFDSDDEQILKILSESEGIEKIVVINKEDLKRKLFHEKLNSFQQVSISTKDTIEPLLRKIEKILDSHDSFEEHMLVSKRQRDIVVKTIEELNIAVEIVQEGSLELFSYHIQNSVQYITEITKPYDYSEVMDVMFGDFCLGK